MKGWIFGIFVLQLGALAQARDYGHYEISKIVTVSGTETGKPSATFNVTYLAQILDDLGSHAGVWPAQFDSTDDQHRAEHDVVALSSLLDPALHGPCTCRRESRANARRHSAR